MFCLKNSNLTHGRICKPILLKWDLKTNQNSTLNAEVPVYKLGIVNLKTDWVYRYPETSRSCGRCFLH